MTTSKLRTAQPNTECCMCGDLGFSDQLFHCKLCQFRSQHRYCSNLYPRTESPAICNWCLSQKESSSPNSSNSSSSYRNNNNSTEDDEGKNKKIINNNNTIPQNTKIKKGLRGSSSCGGGSLNLQIHKPTMMMKKHKSPPEAISRSPSASTSPSVLISTRKRIITNGALEERLRRTRSEDIMNSSNTSGATKQVFRNKVRRYKLLDEVSLVKKI